MDAIPARVLKHFNLPPDAPQMQLKEGVQCDTWIAGDLVIQNVSKQSYEHHLAVLERTATMRKSGKLTGLVFLLETLHDEDGSWWRAAPRIPGVSAAKCGRPFLDVAEEIAVPIGEELATLATLPKEGLPPASVNQDIPTSQITSALHRHERYALFNLAEKLPPEPTTPVVLAHGDPVFKNIMLTEKGPILIDWEFCQALPAGNDPAHFLAALIYNCAADTDMPRVLRVAHDLTSAAGLSLDDDELRALIAWGMLREVAIWNGNSMAAMLPVACRALGLC